jgi:hypothetical protein
LLHGTLLVECLRKVKTAAIHAVRDRDLIACSRYPIPEAK